MTKKLQDIVKFYQKRFAFQAPKIRIKPHSDTKIMVTIPCFDEANLLDTLNSLKECSPSQFPIEVLIIINSGEHHSQDILKQNQKTLEETKDWISQNNSKHLSFYVLHIPDLPKKYAGVGLARKIIMDEALYRFSLINFDGGIVCLDADCLVAENYLIELEKAFLGNINSASIHFEHQLFKPDRFYKAEESNLSGFEELNEGITNYELFLRYYVQALVFTNYPKAFHTIGSSMAVRASIYGKSGGMNRRKAGEDFYFLHKIADLGKHYDITQTTVFPSARTSERVPFGTGKAQEKWLSNSEKVLLTYDTAIFLDLKKFFALTEKFYTNDLESFDKVFNQIPQNIQAFFQKEEFYKKIKELNQKSTNLPTFTKHYFAWCDGLKVLKIVHFLRDSFYKEIPIQKVSLDLLKLIKPKIEISDFTIENLLNIYRNLDRSLSH